PLPRRDGAAGGLAVGAGRARGGRNREANARRGDEARRSRVALVDEVARKTGLSAIGVSVLDDESLEGFRDALWELTGLIRVYLRSPGLDETEPRALVPGSTVLDAAQSVHHQLAATCAGARVSGPSAKFDQQR